MKLVQYLLTLAQTTAKRHFQTHFICSLSIDWDGWDGEENKRRRGSRAFVGELRYIDRTETWFACATSLHTFIIVFFTNNWSFGCKWSIPGDDRFKIEPCELLKLHQAFEKSEPFLDFPWIRLPNFLSISWLPFLPSLHTQISQTILSQKIKNEHK